MGELGREKGKRKLLKKVVERLNDLAKENEERLHYVKSLFTDSQREVATLEQRNQTLEQSITYHRVATDRLLALERQIDDAESFRREAELRCMELERTIASLKRREGEEEAGGYGNFGGGVRLDRLANVSALSKKTVSELLQLSNNDDNKLGELEVELEATLSKIKLCRAQIASTKTASSDRAVEFCCICLMNAKTILLMVRGSQLYTRTHTLIHITH
jgi:DNA repair exonuclease SbcCD ATPase subunit